MKSDKKPVIGLICVMLSCILIIGITIGLLSSVNNDAAAGSTTDTTDNTSDNIPDTTDDPLEEETQPEPELVWGYEAPPSNGNICSPLMRWPTHMGYKSDLKTFDVDNVKLTLAYGVLTGQEIDEMYIEVTREYVGLDITEFEIYFGNEFNNNIYTVREVKESFINEKYRVEYSAADNYYKFNHSEEITIPKELFTESEGEIKICVGGMNVAGNEPKYEVLCSEDLKYQLVGNDKVVLSPRWEY